MRLLLLALQDHRQEAESSGLEGTSTRTRTRLLEEEQCLALLRAMRDAGRVAPLLVCSRGSGLHQRARDLQLPLLAVGRAGSPLSLLRLWLWQRKHSPLLIQTIGEEALTLGRRVLGMRKPGTAMLCHAFFLRAPAAERCSSRDMLAASHIFCGSEHVKGRIRQAWEGHSRTAPLPALDILAPGMDLEGFAPAPPFTAPVPPQAAPSERQTIPSEQHPAAVPHSRSNLPDRACGSHLPAQPPAATSAACHRQTHFIFGMGDSLIARSGAIAVVRAMAAIWQRTDLPHWEVRMLGRGPRFQEVLSEASNLGVQSRLCLLGEQALPEALSHCHAWLAPGSSPEEELSTLWAGLAAGLPIVCSSTATHLERLGGEPRAQTLARTVDENDPQSLARAMIRIMQDAALRSRLSTAGLAFAPQTSLSRMAEAACRCFEDWLSSLAATTVTKSSAGPEESARRARSAVAQPEPEQPEQSQPQQQQPRQNPPEQSPSGPEQPEQNQPAPRQKAGGPTA